MRKMMIAAAAALATVSTAAFAAVTLNADGTGFVGKGDVQTPFGWNDNALQKKAAGVTFTLEADEEYEAVCTWTTAEGKKGEKIHNVPHKRKVQVNSAVSYETRLIKSGGNAGKINGFTLLGFGADTSIGILPVVGGACNGNEGHDGLWSAVTYVGGTGEALYANHTEGSHVIWTPPVAVIEPVA